MEIILTPEIEKGLVEQAEQMGISPQALALESLRRQFAVTSHTDSTPATAWSLADFLGDAIGIVDSGDLIPGGGGMSVSADDLFTQGLVEKREKGRL